MSIFETIISTLSDLNVDIFEPKSFRLVYNDFFDKHLTEDDINKENENFDELVNLMEQVRTYAFSAGFRIATRLWVEGMKDIS